MDNSELIDRLNALTDAIEHASAMADWVEAARLAGERAPLVAALSPEQPPAGLAAVRRMQDSDARIVALASTAQQELTAEYGEAMARVRAADHYQQMACR